jgi:Spy/CpxP family protein refolding chaperone
VNVEVRKKAAIWLVLVFVIGAATGGVFGYSLAHRSYAATKLPVQTDAERRAKKVAEMTQEIGLTPDQAQKVDALITEAQTEIRTIHDQSDAQVDAVRMKTRDAMRAFLRAEQKPKFEEYVQRLDAERKKQKEAQMGR